MQHQVIWHLAYHLRVWFCVSPPQAGIRQKRKAEKGGDDGPAGDD
jgi:hypothetical protein